MSKRILPLVIIILGLLAWGCESPEDGGEVVEVVTPSIKTEPFYFSFATGDAVREVHDLTLMLDTTVTPSVYSVALNAAANVSAAAITSGDFASVAYTGSESFEYDTETDLVIGSGWMDPSTYNQEDNHSISSNGTYYFVRTTDYQLLAFMVEKASTLAFDIKYAQMNADSTFSTAMSPSVPYSADEPAYFDMDGGATVEPANWHIGLITAPVPGAPFPMQNVILNFDNETRVAVIDNKDFEDIESVPTGLTWVEDSHTSHPLAYSGAHELITYNPDTHKVSIKNDALVYIVDTGDGNYYKLRFTDYDSGIVLFEYAAL
ncbi:MAG: hypothetical protein J3T61_11595 [Candidatus Brocadiales bacterium]|nr:hypothetical protein [Candidatus Bathyanammoxibius sp.]